MIAIKSKLKLKVSNLFTITLSWIVDTNSRNKRVLKLDATECIVFHQELGRLWFARQVAHLKTSISPFWFTINDHLYTIIIERCNKLSRTLTESPPIIVLIHSSLSPTNGLNTYSLVKLITFSPGKLWRAPEFILSENDFKGSQKGDIYSFAIIINEILTRQYPFETYSGSPKGTTTININHRLLT